MDEPREEPPLSDTTTNPFTSSELAQGLLRAQDNAGSNSHPVSSGDTNAFTSAEIVKRLGSVAQDLDDNTPHDPHQQAHIRIVLHACPEKPLYVKVTPRSSSSPVLQRSVRLDATADSEPGGPAVSTLAITQSEHEIGFRILADSASKRSDNPRMMTVTASVGHPLEHLRPGARAKITSSQGDYAITYGENIMFARNSLVFKAEHTRIPGPTVVKVLRTPSHPVTTGVPDESASKIARTSEMWLKEFKNHSKLSEHCGSCTLNVDEAAQILGDMSAAVAYVHGQGIVHNDIKPANILFKPSRGAVLIDFGLSSELKDTAVHVGGSPWYIPPEIPQEMLKDHTNRQLPIEEFTRSKKEKRRGIPFCVDTKAAILSGPVRLHNPTAFLEQPHHEPDVFSRLRDRDLDHSPAFVHSMCKRFKDPIPAMFQMAVRRVSLLTGAEPILASTDKVQSRCRRERERDEEMGWLDELSVVMFGGE
ncbi:hypothetical protein K4K54_012514 [Colletotrichum sp. SAR 10_86]|nr:hypothetical protein K4K54_012514 [Colletotrichum sp. SAR 10_86]